MEGDLADFRQLIYYHHQYVRLIYNTCNSIYHILEIPPPESEKPAALLLMFLSGRIIHDPPPLLVKLAHAAAYSEMTPGGAAFGMPNMMGANGSSLHDATLSLCRTYAWAGVKEFDPPATFAVLSEWMQFVKTHFKELKNSFGLFRPVEEDDDEDTVLAELELETAKALLIADRIFSATEPNESETTEEVPGSKKTPNPICPNCKRKMWKNGVNETETIQHYKCKRPGGCETTDKRRIAPDSKNSKTPKLE